MNKTKFLHIILFLLFIFSSQSYCEDRQDKHMLNPALLGPETKKLDYSAFYKIYYVSEKEGSDENKGGSKNNPWQSIYFALSKAKNASAEQKYAIIVAEGIYSNATLKMVDYVDLYGGFSSETWERDIHKYTTVLDGRSVRRVVLGADYARLDGFTVRNGLSRSHGGGILCDDTSPTISNNFIIKNFVLEPEKFNHNRIHQSGNIGGGIACLYNAVPIIKNNIFYDNKTSVGTGGAIAFYGWFRKKDAPSTKVEKNRLIGGMRSRVENNIIINNVAGINDLFRTRSSSGGGIACAHEARPIIQNNLIAMNQAMGNSDAGGIYCEYYSDPDIVGNWVLGNIGDDDGGGFYTMRLGQPLLKNNIIAGNYTKGKGVGGIRISKEGRARIVDNVIVQNPGGGVMCVDSYIELIGNVIISNSSGVGFLFRSGFDYLKPSTVSKNIIINNEKGAVDIQKNSKEKLEFNNNTLENDYEGKQHHRLKGMETKEGLDYYFTKAHFDSTQYHTYLILQKPIKQNLTGRVVKINDKWSLVKNQQQNRIIIWGNILDMNVSQNLYVLPVYRH
jgi:hypothetical protein